MPSNTNELFTSPRKLKRDIIIILRYHIFPFGKANCKNNIELQKIIIAKMGL
jgi:hypothetical protein